MVMRVRRRLGGGVGGPLVLASGVVVVGMPILSADADIRPDGQGYTQKLLPAGVYNGRNFSLRVANTQKYHPRIISVTPIEEFLFIYFFFHFRKINGQTKNFKKYTSAAVPHGGSRR
jgi:hypothetical protein